MYIYPNPVTNKLNIEVNGFTGKLSTTITDEKGSTYMRSEFVLNNRGKQELDVSQLKPGVYYLHLRTANTDQVLKFLKL